MTKDRSSYNIHYRHFFGEKMIGQIRDWFKSHPEYRREYYRKWRLNHPGYHRQWQRVNNIKYRNYQKEWRNRNAERMKIYIREYMRKYRKSGFGT